ncbi:MAG: AsmA family protein [Pararhodobacter sp.]|nr:AsmA family protein [Pararhodobacter sp.]
MRWIVRILAVLFTLVLLALSAIFLIPAERLAGIAAQQFQTATGRLMAISGTVRPSLFPVIGARVEGVRIENAPWSDAGPMLEADVMDLGLDLVALTRGDFIIRRFELHAPRILLERHADGRANWLFEGLANGGGETDSQPPASDAGQPARTLAVDLVEIHDAALRFVDHVAGTDMHLQGLDGELRLPDFDGPASLSLTGQLNGQAFTAEAGIGAFSSLLAGEVTAISARLLAGDAALGFEGRAGLQPLAAEGRASFEARALAPLMALAGQSGPEPLPAVLRPLGFAGQITLAPAGSVHLREGVLAFGPNRAVLALDLSYDGPRPRLTGSVTAESLDLRGLGGEAGGAGAGGGEGWPRTPIDASAVGLADAAVTIRSGPVQSDALDLQSLHIVLNIDRARAVFDLREIRLFDGLARGEFVINNRSGLSVGGNLRAGEIALLPMLTQLADFERISGTGQVELSFLGVGESLDAIMRRLSGEGRIELGEGEILGLDLAGMLRNLDMSYMGEGNRTIFDSVTGSFTIQNGVLDSRDLQLDARRVAVAGRGLVDIGERRLDYRLAPSAMRDPESGAALTVPLQVTGPWSQPRFRLDLEGLAEERLREERERLEARARQEIERIEQQARERAEAGLRERLGVEAEGENGQSLRDGARERLEGEIGRGLQRFLGGGNTD